MTIYHIPLLHILPLLLLHHSISRPRFCHAQVAYLVSLWGESLGLAMAAAPWGERLNGKASRCSIIHRWCDFSYQPYRSHEVKTATSRVSPAKLARLVAIAWEPSVEQKNMADWQHLPASLNMFGIFYIHSEQPHPSPLWEAFDVV